jgi:hypothetical protein
VTASIGRSRPATVMGRALAHHELHIRPGFACSQPCPKRRARPSGQPYGLPHAATAIGWAPAHHELHTRPSLARSLRCLKRGARPSGQPYGLPHAATAIGWAPAHHELHIRPGFACSQPCPKRRARPFGPSFGRPDLLLFAWPLRRRSGANAEGGPERAEGRTPGVKRSRQEKGRPSSAPSAPPCAAGSRVSAGVRGRYLPALSRTSPASLPAPLRADRPSLAAPLGPREERGLLSAGAAARECAGLRTAAQAQARAAATCARP